MRCLLESTHFLGLLLLKTGQDLLIFLLFIPFTSEREWNTTLMRFIDLLRHRYNVACVSFFYRHYNGFCSSETSGHISEDHVFLHTTRLSQRAYPYVFD